MAETGGVARQNGRPVRPELVWPGKYDEAGNLRPVSRASLPFQVIERVNESRATREARKGSSLSLFDVYEGDEGETFDEGWRNKLIWGDNLLVIGSLLENFAGKVDLIYIDPPFATGVDFAFQAEVGDGTLGVKKEHSALEEKAYRDTWGKGVESYLEMIYERLTLMREALTDKGSIYIHLDPTMSHRVKIIMDEVFGPSNFRSEIVWRRSNSHNKLTGQYGPIHDSILYYTKGDEYTFHPGTTPFSSGYIRSRFKYEDHRGIYQPNYLTGPGRRAGESGKPWRGFDPTPKGRHWAIPRSLIRLLDLDVSGMSTHAILDLLLEKDLLVIPKKVGGQPMYKQYLTEGIPYQDVWGYLPNSHGYLYGTEECLDQDVKWLEQEDEKLGFATQKPEGLLRRIIRTSSDPGDLVADFFCGSGTTLAAAEKLGRRWLGCDLGRWGVHVSRKRLLGIPDCKPFEVMNLGHYERQFWQGAAFGGGREISERTLYEYIAFVLRLYGAEPITGSSYLHGRKGGAVVHVGSVDSPVTIHEVARALEECLAFGQKELHVLGWEWEMGLVGPDADGSGQGGLMQEQARRLGVKLLLLQIPREVMEQQAVDRGTSASSSWPTSRSG